MTIQNLHRRAMLGLLPAAGAALALPATAAEHPRERVNRLMDELSLALRKDSGDYWFAQVHPARGALLGGALFHADNYHRNQSDRHRLR